MKISLLRTGLARLKPSSQHSDRATPHLADKARMSPLHSQQRSISIREYEHRRNKADLLDATARYVIKHPESELAVQTQEHISGSRTAYSFTEKFRSSYMDFVEEQLEHQKKEPKTNVIGSPIYRPDSYSDIDGTLTNSREKVLAGISADLNLTMYRFEYQPGSGNYLELFVSEGGAKTTLNDREDWYKFAGATKWVDEDLTYKIGETDGKKYCLVSNYAEEVMCSNVVMIHKNFPLVGKYQNSNRIKLIEFLEPAAFDQFKGYLNYASERAVLRDSKRKERESNPVLKQGAGQRSFVEQVLNSNDDRSLEVSMTGKTEDDVRKAFEKDREEVVRKTIKRLLPDIEDKVAGNADEVYGSFPPGGVQTFPQSKDAKLHPAFGQITRQEKFVEKLLNNSREDIPPHK